METWYIMEDGSAGDPAEISYGKDGKLAHKDGRKVAYRPDGETPRSRGVDADAERAKKAAPKVKPVEPKAEEPPVVDPDGNLPSEEATTETRDLTAEKPKRGYRTRESKAD